MTWNIRFPKDQMVAARDKGKELFAIGYHGSGRAEAFMHLDDERVSLLWIMANEMNAGRSPREAMTTAETRIAEHKAKIAPRRATANGATEGRDETCSG